MEKKKIITMFLVICIACSSILIGCGNTDKLTSSSSEVINSKEISSKKTESSLTLVGDKVVVFGDVFLTTIPAHKRGDEMLDEEIVDITYKMIDNANIVWRYLYFGIENLPVDEEDLIQHDGDIWYRIKDIDSLNEYKDIVSSVCDMKFYEQNIFPALKPNMLESKGKLYQCKNRAGSGSGDTSRKVLSVSVLEKEADEIRVKVRAEGITAIEKDGVLSYEDGDLLYILTIQNGNWVVNTCFGEIM